MKKSYKVQAAFRGEITAFLALIFILMLSVMGALIESASIQITKSRKRADAMLALESVFAEYDRQMLEEYDLFVRLGSNEDVLKTRLEYYGADGMEHQVSRMEVLSDYQGDVLYQQAVRYVKNLTGLEQLLPDERYRFDTHTKAMEEELQNEEQLHALLEQEKVELPTDNNPLHQIEKLKQSPLLTVLVSDTKDLSNRGIQMDDVPSKRTLLQGNFKQQSMGNVADQFFYVEYLMEHFSHMTKEDDSHALSYELEYLLEGHASDKENLEAVCEKILLIRTGLNYLYLLTDSAKQAEAEVLSIAICNVLTVTGLSALVKQAILLGWAYGESIVDVRALLKGKSVAIVKSSSTWQLQLSNLVKLGTRDEIANEKDVAGGLTYEDYLKGLLWLERKESLCMRTLDLIESNLKIRVDQCVTKIELQSRLSLRHSIQETFYTAYGYQ